MHFLTVIVPIYQSIIIKIINKKGADYLRRPMKFPYYCFYANIKLLKVYIKKTPIAVEIRLSAESKEDIIPFEVLVRAAIKALSLLSTSSFLTPLM